MKKLVLSFVGVAMTVGVVVTNISVNSRRDSLSDLALENVEALATGEINPDCPNGCTTEFGYCWCYGPYLKKEGVW